ncbi:hypothetical protein ABTW24_16005 [Sphingobacterium thalpophilum]|uniref:Uncharacterized protein n=1 Tax=Sphingobacterium thalpophilum TaxID=259 RepID=A0A4U9VUA3_9SPHI|nr:hypothetical protein [Sphingobacterium thalpophilum]VTR50183.1 Uncharacterised protein [Sphingobacterium thalpophilum]
MEKSLEYGRYGRNGTKPFFSALSNPHPPIGGRIFCSPEQSKLCFEMLEINSRTSKPLAPPVGGELLKHPPKSGFMLIN